MSKLTRPPPNVFEESYDGLKEELEAIKKEINALTSTDPKLDDLKKRLSEVEEDLKMCAIMRRISE